MIRGLKLWTAFLADFASPANGLLQVVNGGINALFRPAFPAPMKVYLAGFLQISPEYDGRTVPVSFIVRSAENDDVCARVDAESAYPRLDGQTQPALVPFVVDLTEVQLPRTGEFIAIASIAGEQIAIEFQALPPRTEA